MLNPLCRAIKSLLTSPNISVLRKRRLRLAQPLAIKYPKQKKYQERLLLDWKMRKKTKRKLACNHYLTHSPPKTLIISIV